MSVYLNQQTAWKQVIKDGGEEIILDAVSGCANLGQA